MNSMQNQQQAKTAPEHRDGFTLIEMLVAVALVLLMMTMFAQIFQMATGAMNTQKGLAENNQRARRLETLLSSDLQRRTYRAVESADGIVPLVAYDSGMITPGPLYTPSLPVSSQGYLYISENTPEDDTDDVLQFTMQASSPVAKLKDASPFSGRARFIGTTTDLNQPEADDGGVEWNGTEFTLPLSTRDSRGSSDYAEVCYFLRNGNLYRRVLLIREPFDSASPLPDDLQNDYFEFAGNSTTENFYTDFDFSAYHEPATGSDDLNFHKTEGVDHALINSAVISLGIPKYRFGFFGDFTVPGPGTPFEFITRPSDSTTWFIGRFTHQETSDVNFGYPGRLTDTAATPAAFNPYVDPLEYDDTRGVVAPGPAAPPNPLIDFSDRNDGRSRRAEDIVLGNVHSFDVKVFDVSLGRFMDLGHSDAAGHYFSGNNQNNTYGNRFDTWHVDQATIGNQQTPFNPVDNVGFGPDRAPGEVGVDEDGDSNTDFLDPPTNSMPDLDEVGWPGTDDFIPLRAIQITIRYLDVSSDQLRDLTIIHSFADR